MPDEVTSVGRILQFPPIPEVPEPLRGRSFVIVEAVFSGSEADGAELLRAAARARPEHRHVRDGAACRHRRAAHGSAAPVPYSGRHQLLDDADAEAIDAVVARSARAPARRSCRTRCAQCGGALAREAERHGAIASAAGQLPQLRRRHGVRRGVPSRRTAHLELLQEALAQFDTGRKYLNFTEQATNPAHFYTPGTWARLQAVKAEVDPDRLFRANHAIDPAR